MQAGMATSSSIASALALISSPQTFTGVSKFSSDLQSILTRSQQIAQIPVRALQNDQATLTGEVTALTKLQSAVGSLSSTIGSLGFQASAGALSATSDNTKVSAAISGSGATSGAYTIGKITSLASVSTATMLNPVADASTVTVAPTDTNTLYLQAGGDPIPITLTAETNNLNGLRDAINGANAGVTASILTTSQGSYLTLSAIDAGPTAISLRTAADSGVELLSMNNTGSLAQFEVNGKPATSGTNQITGVIPGVALTLKGTTETGETANITVSGNAGAVAAALQNVAAAYNSLSSSIDLLTAPGTGALAGNQLARSVRSLMRDFAFYQGTGSVGSLMNLGVSFDKSGVMTVDTNVLSAMPPGQLTNVLSFVGDGTKGLSALSAKFSAFSDTTTGTIQQSISQDQVTEQRLQDQIDAMSVRIQAAQKTQLAKLQAADSLLALLTSQQSMLTSSIQSLNYTLYGTQTSANGTGS